MSRRRKTHERLPWSRGDVAVLVVTVGIMVVCALILAYTVVAERGGAL